jgi:hypothetical protein
LRIENGSSGGFAAMKHWFWWLMTMACVTWYLTVTIYVAIKGAGDIKQMLARLASNRAKED